MTPSALFAPAPATSCFERWYRHFLDKGNAPDSLPWREPYRLSPTELRLVVRSIQQFQLGEWARGRGFKRRAACDAVLSADRWFLPTLELFIAEEQGHSSMLGRFLDHEQIPRLTNDWLDGAFRRLRKLAGLELCVTVLVTAEVLAMPFYQALRDATRSNLLRSICVRILCDEAAHLNFQALTIGLASSPAAFRPGSSAAFLVSHHAIPWHSLTFVGAASQGVSCRGMEFRPFLERCPAMVRSSTATNSASVFGSRSHRCSQRSEVGLRAAGKLQEPLPMVAAR